MSEPTALELAKHVVARIVGLQAHPATGHLLDPDMHAQLKLAREVIRLSEREARLVEENEKLRETVEDVAHWHPLGWDELRNDDCRACSFMQKAAKKTLTESRTTPEPARGE